MNKLDRVCTLRSSQWFLGLVCREIVKIVYRPLFGCDIRHIKFAFISLRTFSVSAVGRRVLFMFQPPKIADVNQYGQPLRPPPARA